MFSLMLEAPTRPIHERAFARFADKSEATQRLE